MKIASFSNNAIIPKECLSFEIVPLDCMEQNQVKNTLLIHTQKAYEIIWIQEGSGIHTINQTSFELSGNKVYCAVPGQVHQLIVDPGSKGYIVSFTEAFLNRHYNEYSSLHEENFFHRILQNPELSIENDLARDMQDVILLLLKETKNNFDLRTEIIVKYLKIFLIYLKRHLGKEQLLSTLPNNNNLLKNFLFLLENNFKEKKTVSHYAKELCVTPNHLNRVLKNTTGFSARHHIQQRIVLEAKRKAHQSRDSMKEIAYYLGFDDLAHFSKFFKNISGINFTTFKKETNHFAKGN